MKKIICDRCGKEMESIAYETLSKDLNAIKIINGIDYKLTSQVGFDVRTYDLCRDCQNDLCNWLNGGREEEK